VLLLLHVLLCWPGTRSLVVAEVPGDQGSVPHQRQRRQHPPAAAVLPADEAAAPAAAGAHREGYKETNPNPNPRDSCSAGRSWHHRDQLYWIRWVIAGQLEVLPGSSGRLLEVKIKCWLNSEPGSVLVLLPCTACLQ